MYFDKWPPRSRIHSFSTFYSSCFLATRVCPRLDPLRLHTGLGLARTPAILYDPGCRLHILRCEPRCAMMHVSAVVIRCKSSLSRTVTPAHQDACRCRDILSVYTWVRDSPRANQLLDNSAVVTFMVLPSQTKIDLRASPWLVGVLPTWRGSAQACRWISCWSMVRGVCCCCICMYTLSRRLRALHAYPPGSADSS